MEFISSRHPSIQSTIGPLSFSIECLTAFLVFLGLSRKWPDLIKATRRLEVIFLRGPYAACPESQAMSRNVRLTGTIFLLGAVGKLRHDYV